MNQIKEYYATGKRKTSIARVHLRPGNGKMVVNKRPLDEYFRRETLKMIIRQPLELTETMDKFDILATVRGGGSSGQADAVKSGISKALVGYNEELRSVLKKAGFLTRNARIKERKKYGQRGARAQFQYSKR